MSGWQSYTHYGPKLWLGHWNKNMHKFVYVGLVQAQAQAQARPHSFFVLLPFRWVSAAKTSKTPCCVFEAKENGEEQ